MCKCSCPVLLIAGATVRFWLSFTYVCTWWILSVDVIGMSHFRTNGLCGNVRSRHTIIWRTYVTSTYYIYSAYVVLSIPMYTVVQLRRGPARYIFHSSCLWPGYYEVLVWNASIWYVIPSIETHTNVPLHFCWPCSPCPCCHFWTIVSLILQKLIAALVESSRK